MKRAGWIAVLLCGACGEEDAPTSPTDARVGPKAEAFEEKLESLRPPGETSSPGLESLPDAWFVDATQHSGIDFVHDAGFSDEKHLPETMGGGALVLDVEGDGDLDLYFLQGGPVPVPAAGPRGADVPPNALYRNEKGKFHDATGECGDAAHRGYGQGGAAGDVDGDGAVDLYVTNFGPDAFLLNDGSGRFTERTFAAGLGDPRWTAGCVFFDADGDGDLDLYVTAYVDIDVSDPVWCGKQEPGWRSYCHPDRYAGLPDRFWRNEGDGAFEEATESAGLADNRGKGLGALAADFDGDGSLDLYVANDSVENRLWRGRGDGTFADATLLSGTGVNGRGATEAGMGLAAGDIDGDLDLDLFVTNFDDESNTLYRNVDGTLFEDGTAELGLDAPSRLPVGFGTVLEDFDADGDLDLIVANGHIIDNIERYHDGKTWKQPTHLYVNAGSRFRLTHGEGLGLPYDVGRGIVTGDFDGDGDADLVTVACGGKARLFVNRNPVADLFVVRGLPRGTRAVATTASRKILRISGPQPSYYGQTEDCLRFASAEPIDALELTFPGGATARWTDLPAPPALIRRTAEGRFEVQTGR